MILLPVFTLLLVLLFLAYGGGRKFGNLLDMILFGGSLERKIKPGWISLVAIIVVALFSGAFLFSETIAYYLSLTFNLNFERSKYIGIAIMGLIFVVLVNFIFLAWMRWQERELRAEKVDH